MTEFQYLISSYIYLNVIQLINTAVMNIYAKHITIAKKKRGKIV